MGKIEQKDIVSQGVFDEFIKGAQDSTKAIDGLIAINKKALETINQISSGITFDENLSKNIKKLNEQTVKLKNTEKDAEILKREKVKTQKVELDLQIKQEKELERLIKLEEKDNKVKKKSIGLTEEEVKAKLKLQEANNEQKKAIKDLIILENKQAGTEERLLATNRKLARERAKLSKLDKNYERDLRRINKRIDSNNKLLIKNSDKLKKNRLQVGGYSDAIKEASKSSGMFSGVLGKLQQIQGTLNAFRKKAIVTQEISTANTYKQIVAEKSLTRAKKLGLIVQKALNTAMKASIIGAIVVAIGAIATTLQRTQKEADKLSDMMSNFGSILDVVIDRISQVGSGLILMGESIKQGFSDVFTKIEIGALKMKLTVLKLMKFELPPIKIKGVDVFEGAKFGTSTEKIKELEMSINDLNGELSKSGEFAKGYNMIATSLDGMYAEMEKEGRQGAEFNRLRRELNREMEIFSAHQSVEITKTKELKKIVLNKLNDDKLRLKTAIEIQKIENELTADQLAFAERSLALSIDTAKLDGERLAFIEKIKDGTISTAEAIKKAEQFTISSAAGENTLFEIIEKIKNIEKERQRLADVRASTEKRIGSITKEIAGKQSKGLLVVAQNELKFAKDRKLSEDERLLALIKFQEASISAYKIQADANIITIEEFNARRIEAEKRVQIELIKLQVSKEKAEFKLSEFRKQQEIDNANNIEERVQAELELNALRTTMLLQQEGLLEDEKTLILEKEEANRLKIIKKGMKDEKDLQKEQDDFLKQQYEEAEADKRARDKKAVEDRKKIFEAGLNIMEQLAKKRGEANLKVIDDETQALKEQGEQLKRDAENGIANTEENIATNKKLQEEAGEARREEIQRQKTEEMQLAFLKILASKADSGDENPFLSAVIEFGQAEAFISSLSGFYDGTDNVGESLGAPTLKGKDGHIIRVDGSEGIFSGANMAEMNNDSRAGIIANYKLGEKYKANELQNNNVTNVYNSNAEILQGFDELAKSFKHGFKSMPTHRPMYDPIRKTFTEVIKTENRKQTFVTKVGDGGILG